MSTPNIDADKITNDALQNILEYLHNGKILMEEANVENKESIEEYYNEKIVQFSLSCNWPALPTVYKNHQVTKK